MEKASRASNASCLNDNGMSPVKIVPSTSLRDCSNGSVDQTRNPGMAIPPLTHNLSATTPTITSGMGTISGIQSYRYELGKEEQNVLTYLQAANINPSNHLHYYFQTSGYYSFFKKIIYLFGCVKSYLQNTGSFIAVHRLSSCVSPALEGTAQ